MKCSAAKFWFVARTIAHVEIRMRKYLEDLGLECFVPTTRELVKRKNEMLDTEVPIIHCLIFLKTDYVMANHIFNQNSRSIFRIFGEKGLLYVPDKQMEFFIRFVTEFYGKVKILDSGYVVGDKMMIKKGPFAGTVGKVIQINNKDYFTISLDGLLVAAVKLSKSNLVKIKSEK